MNLLIVGAGGIGAVHARHAMRLDGCTVGIYDPEAAKAHGLAATVGATAFDTEADAMKFADAAVVAVPSHLHQVVATGYLEAGKAVMIEKPLCRTNEQANELIKVAEGKVCAVAQVVRFFPEHESIHKVVKSGKIGRPASARMRRCGGLPKNYDGWFKDEDKSGGILVDLAVHDFDWLRWTFGEIEQVFACRARAGRPDLRGDYALVTLKTKSGVLCHVETSWLESSFRASVEVAGSEGAVEWDSRTSPTFRFEADGNTAAMSPNDATVDPFYRQLVAFKDLVDGKPSPIATIEDGAAALRIALAAFESSNTGKPVNLA